MRRKKRSWRKLNPQVYEQLSRLLYHNLNLEKTKKVIHEYSHKY